MQSMRPGFQTSLGVSWRTVEGQSEILLPRLRDQNDNNSDRFARSWSSLRVDAIHAWLHVARCDMLTAMKATAAEDVIVRDLMHDIDRSLLRENLS